MNSDVHPLVAALVVALTVVAIATWVWGRNEAASIGGPAELRVDRNGHLYIQIQNKLVEHDADGAFVTTHDLTLLGVEQLLGGIAFFSNGDVLLRRGPDPRSFIDNIRAFQRKTNEQSVDATTPNSGLFRCDLQTDECTRFGNTGIDFKAAHSVFIDWSGDDVYVSDTSRHMLRKYSEDGELVAGPVSGFRFPNQLILDDGNLYVADTNNHSIQILDPATKDFGTEIAKKHVVPSEAVLDDQRWPSHMARVDDEWWVNNMSTAMDRGGVYVFDSQWKYDRKVGLPKDADPISLVVFRDEVLISDWYNDRVYRVSQSGSLAGDFESAGLAAIIEDSIERRSSYLLASYAGVAMLALVIGGLFVRALVVTVSPKDVEQLTAGQPNRVDDTPLYLEPTNAAVGKSKLAFLLVGGLLIAFIVTFAVYEVARAPEYKSVHALIMLMAGLAPIFLLLTWVGYENSHSSIRVEGDQVTLRNRAGRESRCALAEVRYDKTIIATHEMAVYLGQQMAPLYDQQALKDQLFPRLEKAQKLSAAQMQLLLLEMRHPQAVMFLLGALSLLIYAVWAILGNVA